MLSLIKKQSLIVFFVCSSALADFGDLPLGWSQLKSEDFQDYAVRSLNRDGSLINNFSVHFWLEQKIIELNLSAEQAINPVTPLILKQNSVNAFAIPGNLIGLNNGLFAFAEDEGEFVSVLAHEMAHISLDHFSRLTNSKSEQGLTIVTGLLLAILLSQTNPEASNAAIFSAFALASQKSLNFSQAMELEADQTAQVTLERAGYNPNAGRTFFQKLQQNSSFDSAYEFLRSHPLGTTRSAMLNSNKHDTNPPEATEYDIIRWRLGLDDEGKALGFFKEWDVIPEDGASPMMKLAWSQWTYSQHGDKTAYLENLSALEATYPTALPALFARLEILTQLNSPEFCASLKNFENLINNQTVTLDVLEFMSLQTRQCSFSSQEEWQAQWLWQAGKEPQALAYLQSKIKSTSELNQLARLKSQLKIYQHRYERFR